MRSFKVLEHDGVKVKNNSELYERVFQGQTPSSAASKAATVVCKTKKCTSITLRIQEVSTYIKNGQRTIVPLLTKVEQKPKEYTYTATWDTEPKRIRFGDKEVEFTGSAKLVAVKDDCSW
jgi:hypothetical protein